MRADTRQQSFGSQLRIGLTSHNRSDIPVSISQALHSYFAVSDVRSVTPNALTYNTRKSIDHQQLGMNYERYIGDATLQVNASTGTSLTSAHSSPMPCNPTSKTR